MRFFRKTSIDFMGKRNMWYMISAAVIFAGIISLTVKGFHFGIDFLGGTEMIVEFSQPPDVSKIRDMLDKANFPKSEIKVYGQTNRLLIRTEQQGEGTTVGDKIKTALQQNFPELKPFVLQDQKIGPKVGLELQRNALFAVLASLVAMGLYVAFRFEFIY